MAGRAHDTATGMRAGTAEIESLDWRAIARAFGRWTEREELIRGDLAMKNISIGQAVTLFYIYRTEHLAINDGVSEVRRKLGHGSNDPIGHLVFKLLGPFLAFQMVRRILAKHGDGMISCRGYRWVSG